MSFAERLGQAGVVPLVVIDDAAAAPRLAETLAANGLPVVEIAWRTEAAGEAIRRIAADCPGVVVGAGTVRSVVLAEQARAAGARFLVAPGLDRRVVEYGLSHDLPVLPGVATPTEIEAAVALGVTLLKLFPAGPLGGAPYLRAVAAPFPEVRFVPTGGLGPFDLERYLSIAGVVACGGSWMAPRDWIAAGAFDRIASAAAEASATVRRCRGAAPR